MSYHRWAIRRTEDCGRVSYLMEGHTYGAYTDNKDDINLFYRREDTREAMQYLKRMSRHYFKEYKMTAAVVKMIITVKEA